MQKNEMPQKHHRPIPYWVIARREANENDPLTLVEGGEATLPVFSFEEEAEMYLLLANPGREWRIRETTSGELVSMLSGPCASIGYVALDPLPELSSRGVIDLVGLSAGRFVDHLVQAQPSII